MPFTVEEPVSTERPHPGGDKEIVTTHPAFGMIGVNRVSGGDVLNGSDFVHGAAMRIRIHHSEIHRSLYHDRHSAREQIIEVALSEAQWATFVSSPNVGDGVPCTIKSMSRQPVPGLPEPKRQSDQFGAEMKTKLKNTLASLDQLSAEIDAIGLSKVKAEALKERVRNARMQLSSNMPYLAECFEEHMETTVEKAKAEVHGYVTGVVMSAGLQHIADQNAAPLLQLGDRQDDSRED